jgi:hypothetical protein
VISTRQLIPTIATMALTTIAFGQAQNISITKDPLAAGTITVHQNGGWHHPYTVPLPFGSAKGSGFAYLTTRPVIVCVDGGSSR